MSQPLTNPVQVDFFQDILIERQRQDKKWGVQNHSPDTWACIIAEEVGEFSQEALSLRFAGENQGFHALSEIRNNALLELTQIAAVALAAYESIIRSTLEESSETPVHSPL